MRILSVKDVFKTFQQLQPAQYQEFYQEFIICLGNAIDLTVSSIDDSVRLQAALSTSRLPEVFRSLFVIMQAKLSPLSNTSIVKLKPKKTVESVSPPTPDRPLVLSKTKAKRLRSTLMGYPTPYPRVCKTPNCKICASLATTCTVTTCKHGGRPHPMSLFPHLPDSVVASAHRGSKVVSPYEGAPNPCLADNLPVPMVQEEDLQVPESETSVPVSEVSKTSKRKKKRKPTSQAEPEPPLPSIQPAETEERNKAFVIELISQCVAGGQDRLTTLRLLNEIGYNSKDVKDLVCGALR